MNYKLTLKIATQYDSRVMALRPVSQYLKTFAQCIDAQIEQQLPSLLLRSQFLPDSMQPLIEMYAQTSQNLFLCNIYGFGMSFPASK